MDWRPTATLDALQARARLLATVRAFFHERGVLEVETPLLASASGTDPHLQPLIVPSVLPGDTAPHYLQTSPEFAMKRLLAAGSGDIYQICKAFRADERSRRHNPEFSMLEWYRLGFDAEALMDDVAALVRTVTGCEEPQRLSYRALFQAHLDLDPHLADRSTLIGAVQRHIDFDPTTFSRDDLLQLLLAEVIEPRLTEPTFVTDFPASMAALARIEADPDGVPVGKRFELFMSGMEIANGYHELTDATEQRQRFLADNALRAQLGYPPMPLDEALLAALAHGLPDCAGVALGLDRLLMVGLGTTDIAAVIPFPLFPEVGSE